MLRSADSRYVWCYDWRMVVMDLVNNGLRATYRRRGNGWEGVVKDDTGRIVAVCGHYHHNRDQNTSLRGPAARSCADDLLRTVTGDPAAPAKAMRVKCPWMR